MTDHVKDIFSRMLGTKEIPEKLVKLYKRVKFLNDRIAPGPMPASTLAILAVLSGEANTADSDAEPAKINWDTVKKETPVTTFWDGKPCGGIFLGKCGSKKNGLLRIKIDGDAENYREIAENDVKLKE
jgi:hypothetical protein